MADSTRELISSYDLLGKSIPGAIFILSIALLLPSKINIPFEATQSQLELIFRLIALLLAGLIIGEAIHTVAVALEKLTLYIAQEILTVCRNLRDFVTEREQSNLNANFDSRREKISQCLCSGVASILQWRPLKNILQWLYSKTYVTVQDHRILFRIWILKHFAQGISDSRAGWEPTNNPALGNAFHDSFHRKFNKSLLKGETSPDIYTIISSSVNISDATLSKRFQTVYSFNRSMSLVTILAFFWYHISTFILGPDFSPWWINDGSGSDPIIIVAILIFGGVIAFVSAYARYKQIYVEYLISDFAVTGEN